MLSLDDVGLRGLAHQAHDQWLWAFRSPLPHRHNTGAAPRIDARRPHSSSTTERPTSQTFSYLRDRAQHVAEMVQTCSGLDDQPTLAHFLAVRLHLDDIPETSAGLAAYLSFLETSTAFCLHLLRKRAPAALLTTVTGPHVGHVATLLGYLTRLTELHVGSEA